MPRLTARNAHALSRGQTLYHHIEKNRDGSPLRARANGKVKMWRRPHNPQWQLPMKTGFKTCFYINDTTVDDWFTLEDEAVLFHKGYTFTNDTHVMVPMNYWYIKCAGRTIEDFTEKRVRHFTTFEDALQWATANLMEPVHV